MAVSTDNQAAVPDQPAAGDPASQARLDELADLVRAYNDVTEKLRHSHETLSAEVVRLRGELASADAQLQRSKRLSALGEMAAGIAHEIRNPLAAIQLYARMVVEDLEPLAAEQQANPPEAEPADAEDDGEVFAPQPPLPGALSNTKKIADAVRSLSAIVNDVLTFARHTEPERRVACVAETLFKAVESHRPELDRHVIEIDVDADPLEAELDHDLLHQAVLNLVRNATDAMADAPVRRLTLSADVETPAAQAAQGDSGEAAAAELVLEVRDTGPGIEADAVDRIFNPFFTTRSAGTGLGLAIVHRIVDAHAGAITVHNDDGAVFRIRIPLEVEGRKVEGQKPQATVDSLSTPHF